MGDLLLALLEPLLEIFGEVVLEAFFQLTRPAFKVFFELTVALIQVWTIGPVTSSIGLLLVGAAAGLLSVFVVPYHLVATRVVFAGSSLLLAPLITGSALYFLGNWLRRFGWRPSKLAGLLGGSLFAFSMALTRWWLVGRYHSRL